MKPTTCRSLAACASFLLVTACSEETPAPAPVVQPAVQPAAPSAAQASAQPAAQPAPQKAAITDQAAADAELAARVKKALESAPGQIAQGIDVTAQRGAVTLFGTVASGGQRNTAASVATSVSGVTSVDNKLVVVKGS